MDFDASTCYCELSFLLVWFYSYDFHTEKEVGNEFVDITIFDCIPSECDNPEDTQVLEAPVSWRWNAPILNMTVHSQCSHEQLFFLSDDCTEGQSLLRTNDDFEL